MKKNFTRFIISSFVLLAVASSPMVSFAAPMSQDIALAATTSTTSKVPVISGISAPTVLKTGQVGTWTIKAFDLNNSQLSYSVDWGDTPTSSFMRTLTLPVFTQTSTFTHSYANPGTYTIKFTVENSNGARTTSTVTVHVMGEPTANAPVISDVTATSTKPTQASLSWKTDVKSGSAVWFSTTTPVDTSGTPNVSRKANVEDHKIKLSKLEPGTKYYFVVGSSNSGGSATSTEGSFTTPKKVNKLTPVITGISASTTIAAGDTETVTVSAYDPKNGPLSYSVDWGDTPTMARMALMATAEQPFVQTSTFTHVYDEPGTYTATFKVKNDAGLETSASIVITVTEPAPDTVDPIISDISTSTEETSGTVSWTTDEPTKSKIFYSETTPVDINLASTTFVSDSTFTTDHSLDISTLKSGTRYYFIIESTDESDNVTTSNEMSFVTESPDDETAPVISGIMSTVGSSTSTITWTTDEPSTSEVFYSTTSPVDPNATTTPFVYDDTLVTNHSINISGLASSTMYHFVVRSADESDNFATSSELMFTTASGM